MKPIPFPTKPEAKDPEIPNLEIDSPPEPSELTKEEPEDTKLDREKPVQKELDKEDPNHSKMDKELPDTIPHENCVIFDGKEIEIKPTKLKYFRNKMASTYSVLKIVPLNELLAYGKGVIDEHRDADQLLFDFLVAVFDDPIFVKNHYDDMTADDVEKIFKIFGRLNHIDEKEEQKRKNMEAQGKR